MTAGLILWTVLVLGCLLTIFISGILACCLRERKQLWCVDVLLVSSTLLIVATLSVNFLLPNIKKNPDSHAQHVKAMKLCDAAIDNIEEAGYEKELSEPAHTIIATIAASKVDKLLNDAESIVQKQVKDFPESDEMSARLAIILHAEGKDTSSVFEHYHRVGGEPSELLSTLQQVYSSDSSTKSAKQDQYDADEIAEIFKTTLPEGWYRTTALIDMYKLYEPNELAIALAKRRSHSQAWSFRVEAFLIVDAILFILGIIALVCFARLKKLEATEIVPLTTSFRRTYACLISTIFAQVIAGGIIGCWIGFTSVLAHKSADISEYEGMMSTTLIVSGTVFCLLLLYLLVLKPQKLTLNKAFTRSSLPLTLSQFTAFWLGGFCAGNVLNIVGRVLYHLVPGSGRPTNPAHLEMVKAFMSGDFPAILKSVIFACLVAPFTEEIMFRGLLFGWLRYRFGSLPAILVSSLLFAMWHFDLNGFVQYFSLGLVLASVYNRTRNLWLSMLIHALWNFWVVSTVYWVTSYK
ncbi:MAG TPA: CPBP family intramembrane glutamic endopeptidase [Drouetiella sp.]|jgi:membrane protease YdiL (CAAX protease family)